MLFLPRDCPLELEPKPRSERAGAQVALKPVFSWTVFPLGRHPRYCGYPKSLYIRESGLPTPSFTRRHSQQADWEDLWAQTACGVDGRLHVAGGAVDARLSSNCKLMEVEPSPLVEVIWPRPGIAANCCSNRVATEKAMVSGLAPGRLAVTVISAVTPAAWDCSGIAGRFSRIRPWRSCWRWRLVARGVLSSGWNQGSKCKLVA